ncbi:hypothetical protein CHS0354_022693 [Potamilus streckersoni]|uniref:Uncharacterized protein n=1 Tax=Potamilus streckersoni TaxID=2493646 RepID=A0AAE0SIV1_9BIVA|nr:hypothetical protein CHS0354_022693 [Potamilus streckersoni]
MATPRYWSARILQKKRARGPESSVLNSDCTDDNKEETSFSATNKKGETGENGESKNNVYLFQEIAMRSGNNDKVPHYLGIVCLSDGSVVVADYNNSKCCSYDSSYNLMSDCTMSSRPWGMCTVDTDEVAVALPDEHKIQLLTIGDKIQISGQITTRRMFLSVASLNKMELVYAGTTDNARTYYWGVIGRDGLEKSCFHIPCEKINFCTVHIDLNSSKTRVLISCYNAGTVYCFGIDGIPYFEYKVKEGKMKGYPLGIQLDRENNMHVVVKNLHSIHRLSPDCQLLQIIKDTIPRFPRLICFKPSGTQDSNPQKYCSRDCRRDRVR